MDNLSERLKAVDRELAEKNIRVSERPREALKILCHTNISTPITIFNISDIPIIKNRELLADITNWYKQLYGTNKVEGNFEIGQKPFLIRGEIYYTKHYVMYGSVTLANILNYIEDLTDELARSLKEEEIESIKNAFNLGHETFISFASLEECVLSVLSKNYSSSLPETAVNFLNRGIANIHGAVATLKYTKDAQSVAFPSQQAVEMFLKAYIAQSKPELNEEGFKKYGHALEKILQKIIEDEQTAEFQNIKSSVQKVDMNINHRYKPIYYPDQKAIETIDSMLKSCHFISERILSKVTVNI